MPLPNRMIGCLVPRDSRPPSDAAGTIDRAVFTPHEHDAQLPVVGSSIERSIVDWKAVADGSEFSKAKDVAAFANHLGGTLLIGCKERETNGQRDGQLEGYRWHSEADAGQLRDAFSKAVTSRCVPLPTFDFAELKNPANAAERVVAVNVWPSLLLIGVKITAFKPTEGYGGEAYVYPVRSGMDARYLSPTEIGMYMTPQLRRVAVLCSRIPKGTNVNIQVPEQNHYFDAQMNEVLEDQNIVTFKTANGTSMAQVPLDCITTVFEKRDGAGKPMFWQMYVVYGRR